MIGAAQQVPTLFDQFQKALQARAAANGGQQQDDPNAGYMIDPVSGRAISTIPGGTAGYNPAPGAQFSYATSSAPVAQPLGGASMGGGGGSYITSVTPRNTGPYGGVGGGTLISRPGHSTTSGDQQLAGLLQDQARQANAEEVARYQKLMGLAQQFGASQMSANKKAYGQQLSQGDATLMNRGLYNSSAALANRTTAANSLLANNQRTAERQAGIQMGVLNNVQVQRPDSGQLASLFSAPRNPDGSLVYTPMPMPDLFGVNAAGGAGSATVKKGN